MARSDVLLHCLETTLEQTRTDSLDSLRRLLIQAGQFEQACADAFHGSSQRRGGLQGEIWAQHMTDAVATAFCAGCHGPLRSAPGIITSALRQARSFLRPLQRSDPVEVSVKVPEGFEFYALFPEQYVAAAQAWSREHARDPGKRVVVIGLRSIGTTLSAIVQAALEQQGWSVRRLTCRPHGPPFAREVQLDAEAVGEPGRAIVVDEGPGLSGSSMASVAQALMRLGFDRSQIAFFPGHGGEPGPAAGPETRHWWNTTRRFVVPLKDLRWHGRKSITQILSERTAALLHRSGTGVGSAHPTEDLSGGAWRSKVFSHARLWPTVAPALERTKFRTGHLGNFLFWKFAGLGAWIAPGLANVDRTVSALKRRARAGWTMSPVDFCQGFVGLPWHPGSPLHREEADLPGHLPQMAEYLHLAGGPVPSRSEHSDSLGRLADMLYWNTHEALDPNAAERTRPWAAAARRMDPIPAFGDGRMSPWEWRRESSGRLVKLDSEPHDIDHLLVGRQSGLWDAAGVIIEWRLKPDQRARFLERVRGGEWQFDEDALRFHELAYTALRLGQLILCPDEAVDARSCRDWLREHLRDLLSRQCGIASVNGDP